MGYKCKTCVHHRKGLCYEFRHDLMGAAEPMKIEYAWREFCCGSAYLSTFSHRFKRMFSRVFEQKY